jgi:hypothetical protein
VCRNPLYVTSRCYIDWYLLSIWVVLKRSFLRNFYDLPKCIQGRNYNVFEKHTHLLFGFVARIGMKCVMFGISFLLYQSMLYISFRYVPSYAIAPLVALHSYESPSLLNPMFLLPFSQTYLCRYMYCPKSQDQK